MDNAAVTSIAYADDICLLASSKEDLETMIKDCMKGFEEAVLETGLNKTFWTSSQRTPEETLRVNEHTMKWSESITFVGAKIEMVSHSSASMVNRIQAASSVFEKWRSILCDTKLDLQKRVKCFKTSVLSSLQWQSGSWTLTKGQEAHLKSWGARLHANMLGVKRNESEDMGQYWRRMHKEGHKCMEMYSSSPCQAYKVQKHRMAGHFTRLPEDSVVNQVLNCRDLSWWRGQQEWWSSNGDKS